MRILPKLLNLKIRRGGVGSCGITRLQNGEMKDALGI